MNSSEHKKLVLSIIEMAYDEPENAKLFFSFIPHSILEQLNDLSEIMSIVNAYNDTDSIDDYHEKIISEARKLGLNITNSKDKVIN